MSAQENLPGRSLDSKRIRDFKNRLRHSGLQAPSAEIALALLRAHLVGALAPTESNEPAVLDGPADHR